MVTLGVQIEPQFGYTYEEVLDVGRACEELGFTTLHISDHLMLSADAVDTPCLEAWTLMSALMADLSKVRIGPLVSSNSYRKPSLLAKMAATLDVISGGRLEFGIGAGWKEVEYNAYGFPFPPARERVDRLGEALQIIHRMWTEDKASFAGQYYTIEEAVCAPKPAQKGGPPIWVGGRENRILRLAVRWADGVNIGAFPTPEEYGERMMTLRRFSDEEGREYDQFGRSHFMWALIAEAPLVDAMVTSFAQTLGAPEDRIRAVGGRGYLGEPEGAAAALQKFIDAGAQHLILMFAKGWERQSMELIHDHVMSQLP